jgi:5-methylcytosine-specific restriction endonuclease McrA
MSSFNLPPQTFGRCDGTDASVRPLPAEKAPKVKVGRVGARLRYKLLTRAQGHCENPNCRAAFTDENPHHFDHIYPVALGGKTVAGNLRVICAKCNLGKSSYRDLEAEREAERRMLEERRNSPEAIAWRAAKDAELRSKAEAGEIRRAM